MFVFVESQGIWVAMAMMMVFVSYLFYFNDKNLKRFLTRIGITGVVLFGGLILEYCVETDREKIRLTLRNITSALLNDDMKTVKSQLAPDADFVKQLAETGMPMANITIARVRGLKIEFNDATPNRTAHVSFRGIVRGKLRGNYVDHGEFVAREQLEIVMEKIDGKWYVTDEFYYEPNIPGLPYKPKYYGGEKN